MRTPSAVEYAPGCGCRVRCDLEAKQGDRWTWQWCPLHAHAGELLAACKAAIQTHSLIEDYTKIRAAIAAAEGKP